MNYFAEIGLILWYIRVRIEKHLDYLTGFGLILWYIGLGPESTWTYWTDSDWFYYDQAGMMLQKYENSLEWSVEQ